MLNRPIRNKNCLWWPRLLTSRDEISSLFKGPSIDAFYRTSFHLAKRFQRQEWPVTAMFVNGSELNEQSLQKTFQGCFLPSFDSFGQAVSDEKIF
jgi:hypothetical protein